LVRAEAAIRQNKILKRLNDLTFVGDIPAVTAQIVLGSPGNFEDTVGLDKGTDDGVAVDMPVVSGRGLMGRVAQASGRRSTVLLVTDAESAVNVRDARSGAYGVLNGRPDNELQSLDFVNADADIRKGDVLVTAGSPSGPFPPGVPVGVVASVTKRPGDLLARISVRLFANATRTEFVMVLQYPKAPGA
jgi:rod shape-determining protein MreC